MEVTIEPGWQKHLEQEFAQPYFHALADFVRSAYTQKTVYPAPKNMFRAFDLCPFEKVSVVILGQDPYHGPKQANGLSFAVDPGTALPPSLKNIFKEISSEYEISMEGKSGDLGRWATQGVLLLNATLTVERGMPGSHQQRGWEQFTDAVIESISKNKDHVVFMLWGNYAKAKGAHIDTHKHLALTAPHPSPFSAHSGFFGCGHFKKANEYLITHGLQPIDWASE